MAIVPRPLTDRIPFFQNRLAAWSANAAAIGLVAGDVTAMTDKTNAAADALADQQTAQAAAKAKTVDLHTAGAAMSAKGAELIAKIKAKAAGSADPDGVYALAQLPPPALPSPVPAPGTPYDLKVTLNPDGSLRLEWKCNNPANGRGTVYQVRRKAVGASSFSSIGAAGFREFLDDTVPAAASGLIYEITAVRSTKRGVSAQFVVNFGTGGGGELFATVAGAAGAKLAA